MGRCSVCIFSPAFCQRGKVESSQQGWKVIFSRSIFRSFSTATNFSLRLTLCFLPSWWLMIVWEPPRRSLNNYGESWCQMGNWVSMDRRLMSPVGPTNWRRWSYSSEDSACHQWMWRTRWLFLSFSSFFVIPLFGN